MKKKESLMKLYFFLSFFLFFSFFDIDFEWNNLDRFVLKQNHRMCSNHKCVSTYCTLCSLSRPSDMN